MNYIADFMCMELKLIIEVDGLTHNWDETLVKDKKRDEDLQAAGFTVIRFTDNEVLTQMSRVIERIEVTINELENRDTPPPTPASGG